jgi:predicted RNA binding protein YcfA (HicA-like mRNA interferase family)
MPRLTPAPYRQLARLFEKEGWQYSRTKGDHLIYTKPGNIRPLVIPMYDDVPVFVVKNPNRVSQTVTGHSIVASE